MKIIKQFLLAILCGFAVFLTFRWITLLLIMWIGGDTFTYSIIFEICSVLGFLISFIYVIYYNKQPSLKNKVSKCGQLEFICIFICLGLIPYVSEESSTVPVYREYRKIIMEDYKGTRILSKSGKELLPRGEYAYVGQVFARKVGKDCYISISKLYGSSSDMRVYDDEGTLIAQYELCIERSDSEENNYTIKDFIEEYVGQIVCGFINRGSMNLINVIDFDCNEYYERAAQESVSESSDTEEMEPDESQDTKTSSSSQTYGPEYATRDEWIPCMACNGSGDCSACKGRGEYPVTNGSGDIIDITKCNVCSQSGRCQICYGTRGHYEKRTYQVR